VSESQKISAEDAAKMDSPVEFRFIDGGKDVYIGRVFGHRPKKLTLSPKFCFWGFLWDGKEINPNLDVKLPAGELSFYKCNPEGQEQYNKHIIPLLNLRK
jgi:hypothetical protein